jgi:hypothetical protein
MLCSAKDACNLISTIYRCPGSKREATRLKKASCTQMQGPKVSLAIAAEACTGVRKEARLACAMRPSQGQTVPRHKSEGATRSLSLLMTHDHHEHTRYDQQLMSMPTLLITAAPCLAPGFFLRFPDRLCEYYTPTLRQPLFLVIVLDFAPRSPGVQFCSTKIKL